MGKFWCLKHGGEEYRERQNKARDHWQPQQSVQKGKLVYKGVEVTHAANAHCVHTDFSKSMVFYTHIQTP